jgi:hypothetical protein
MPKRSFVILIFPVLALLPVVLAGVIGINSPYLTLGVCFVSLLVGLSAGSVLLLLKRKQDSSIFRILFVACMAGLVFAYLDLVVFWLFNAQRPLQGTILLVFLAMVILMSLALLFWRYEDQTTDFFAVLFAVAIMLSIFSIPQSGKDYNSDFPGSIDTAAARSDKLTIYIVLDGMSGSAGLRNDIPENAVLADEIDEFFKTNDFHHFPRAFSQYFLTRQSIPAMLNGLNKGTSTFADIVRSKNNKHSVVENKLFDGLQNDREPVHVYQSSYIDFCDHKVVVKCHTLEIVDPFSSHMPSYRSHGGTLLTVLFKFESILKRSYGTKFFVTALFKPIRIAARWVSPTQYQSASTPDKYGDLTFESWFGTFTDDITASQGGAYFAHFIMPHYPFRLGADCKPVLEYFPERIFDRLHIQDLTEEKAERKREELYTMYRDQVRCVYHELSSLFDQLKKQGRYNDAKIILVSDHGSRISNAYYERQLVSKRDNIDNQSALFSIKKPGGTAVSDQRMLSVQYLLLADEMKLPGNSINEVRDLTIFGGPEDRNYISVPMPEL